MVAWRTFVLFLILGSMILAAPAESTSAQFDSPWRADSVEMLPFDSVALRGVFPAPDGQRYLYMNGRVLCVADLTMPGDSPQCIAVPDDFPQWLETGNPVARPLDWSLDGTRVAIVGAPFGLDMDTDLWLLDTRDMALTNLVDDGYSGPLSEAPAGGTVLSQPAWSPDGTRIAVARVMSGEGGSLASNQLVVLDAASGETLTTLRAPEAYTLFPDDLRFAPDGRTLAYSLGFARGEVGGGLWFLDAESGERRFIAGGGLFKEWFSQLGPYDYSTQIGPLVWSPDGAWLVVWAGSGGFADAPGAAFLIDAGTGLLDRLPSPIELLILSSIVTFEPFQAAWSPDGSALLVAADGALPRHDGLVVDPEAEAGRVTVYVVDMATHVRHVIVELPARNAGNGPMEDYARHTQAVWGPDGHAIIAGYALHLVEE
jgi:dipeptidyl aminopeptidase/acylaminoacyl peptidase